MTSTFQVKYFSVGAGLFLLIATGAWFTSFAVSKRRLYQAQLKAMALYDSLTGLPNRILFFDRLTMTAEHCRRYDSRFGLLYIDLDGFKKVNDTLGHAAGDELLKLVGRQLLAMCRNSDTVARLGGDEFAIISTEIDSASDVETLAMRIIAAFEHPIRIAAGEIIVGASIGIALFPADSKETEDLVRLADKTMYAAKRQGKNRFCFTHAREPWEETA
jgi:diguanylate cyclase (GGDEF)-like protein